MKVAVITGATGGIGSEFCRALDDRGLEMMVILGRNKDSLERVTGGLKTPVSIFPVDLQDRQSLQSLGTMMSEKDFDIRFLVNCAGFGSFGNVQEQGPQESAGMVDLNIVALTELSRACIPMMSYGSWIIQVCSASAYLPLPHLAVYAATKAYVKSFTDALRFEVRGRGINVLEVSPGWVDTGFIDHAMETCAVPEKVFKHKVKPEDVVHQAIRDLEHGKTRSICGIYNKLQVFVCSHFPSVASRVWINSLK